VLSPGALVARLPTAAAALVFATQSSALEELKNIRFVQGAGTWWVRTDLPLEAARSTALACGGLIHVFLNGQLVPDRGWGDSPSAGTGPDPSAFTGVTAPKAVQRAGLTRVASAPVSQAVVLLPGAQLGTLIRRALDLRLRITYQRVELEPLFSGGVRRSAFAVTLEAAPGDLPAHLLAALERDPFSLVCRQVGDHLLVQHEHASPLPDASLSALVDTGVWVLAADGYGCSRLLAHGEPQSGSTFARLDRDHPMVDPPAGYWPDSLPEPPALTVVPARIRGQKVDAILLRDEGLRCLSVLLEGRPLAETAKLVLGRDHHLLLAPGGLLEDLPVGEPLCCLGPGQLYLPLGHRLKPLLPSSARHALLPADDGRGIVLTRGSCMVFDLHSDIPVWELWAGPLPDVDSQLPARARHALEQLEEEFRPAAPKSYQPRRLASTLGRAPRAVRTVIRHTSRTQEWREQAYSLELAGNLVQAAELYRRNDQPLQAARLFERAAELDD
jgi:hypothetical protein